VWITDPEKSVVFKVALALLRSCALGADVAKGVLRGRCTPPLNAGPSRPPHHTFQAVCHRLLPALPHHPGHQASAVFVIPEIALWHRASLCACFHLF
jgi:hypothetical protein